MRIRNPPKFIMSISFIMSLIMTLLVFQCGGGGWRGGGGGPGAGGCPGAGGTGGTRGRGARRGARAAISCLALSNSARKRGFIVYSRLVCLG